jgi:hypothetical protein
LLLEVEKRRAKKWEDKWNVWRERESKRRGLSGMRGWRQRRV